MFVNNIMSNSNVSIPFYGYIILEDEIVESVEREADVGEIIKNETGVYQVTGITASTYEVQKLEKHVAESKEVLAFGNMEIIKDCRYYCRYDANDFSQQKKKKKDMEKSDFTHAYITGSIRFPSPEEKEKS